MDLPTAIGRRGRLHTEGNGYRHGSAAPAGQATATPRPRRRPDCLLGDRGYDHDTYRRLVQAKGIKHRIGRRGTEHGSGLGKHRYVGERTIALLHWFHRLRIRWEIRDDTHEAFLTLATAIICWRRLVR
jgi:hypothetical protein